jgi:hypothetical protein
LGFGWITAGVVFAMPAGSCPKTPIFFYSGGIDISTKCILIMQRILKKSLELLFCLNAILNFNNSSLRFSWTKLIAIRLTLSDVILAGEGSYTPTLNYFDVVNRLNISINKNHSNLQNANFHFPDSLKERVEK